MSERQQEKLEHLTANWPTFTEMFSRYLYGSVSKNDLEKSAKRLKETLCNNLELQYKRFSGESLLDDMLELGGHYIVRTFDDIDTLRAIRGVSSHKTEQRLGAYYDYFETRLAQSGAHETVSVCADSVSGAIYDVVMGEIPFAPVLTHPTGTFVVRMYQLRHTG